jgi:hypothetical protein
VSVAGDLCFAFESPSPDYARATPVKAWFWSQGSSDDCGTRTSDVVAMKALIELRTDSGYDLVLDSLDVVGVAREIRIALHVLAAPESVPSVLAAQGRLTPLGGIDLSDHASIFFVPDETVSPTLAP